jgi:hypothetical protein
MRRLLTAAVLVAGLMAASAPVVAQTNGAPADCGVAVTKLLDNVGMRLQQYNGQTTRESVRAFLLAASHAAAAGNEALCWTYVKRADQVVR